MRISPVRTALALLFIFLAADLRAEPKRHLFLDPALLEKVDNAEVRINPPEQREMVIRPDKPWEGLMISFFLTVLDDNGKLRMWYVCRGKDQANPTEGGNLAYAESTDGIHWTKPELGIAEYQGSKDNNLVGVASLEGTVYRDPKASSSDEKYIYVTYIKKEGLVRFTSPDGLRWKRDEKSLINFKTDTQNVTFWDPNIGSYVVYLRGWTVDDEAWQNKKRQVVRLTASNLTMPLPITPATKRPPGVSPPITTELPVVLKADAEDPENSDVYNISAELYPLDPSWYVGFPSYLKRERSVSDGTVTAHFVGSKDGIEWHKYDRKPYVDLGPADSASASMVFLGTGMVIRGDEIWQYGTGLSSRHGDVKARQKKTDGAIFRYVQRLDGFTSLDFGDEKGSAVTRPLALDGKKLFANVKVAEGGAIRVGLLSPGGAAIPGFGIEDCRPLMGDSTAAEVSWKGGDLSSLKEKTVQLAFAGANAKLYSFFFGSEGNR